MKTEIKQPRPAPEQARKRRPALPAIRDLDGALRRFSDLDNDCLSLQASLAGVQASAAKCTAPGPALDALYVREQELTAELKEQEALRDAALADTQERILRERDPLRQAALYARYVEFESYAEIARRMQMSKSGVIYLVRAALMEMERQEKETEDRHGT